LTRNETIFALCGYGFIASVLPVWLLLCPRDYISSFLKLGTIALLIIGVIAANPALHAPPLNETFASGGPTFAGHIFPFVFICIMCGAISGFHALVSSGTTPKMIDKESHVRPIGYGSMLLEGLVGVVALIAAAAMPVEMYYDINVPLSDVAKHQDKLNEMYEELGIKEGQDPLLSVGRDVSHLNLGQMEEQVGGESLRGRTGGAVTLAVGMASIFTEAMYNLNIHVEGLMKYWYHFAIMFEALFILTTIDTGTRIARFLMQETLGKAYPQFEKTDWLPGAILSTALVTAGWGLLVYTGSIATIWPMFGIANQLLAVLAICLVTTLLINSGRGRYAPVTLIPMAFVTTTTMTAGVQLSQGFINRIGGGDVLGGGLNLFMTLFVMVSVGTILVMAFARWLGVSGGVFTPRAED
jgi:carbon starvation protein